MMQVACGSTRWYDAQCACDAAECGSLRAEALDEDERVMRVAMLPDEAELACEARDMVYDARCACDAVPDDAGCVRKHAVI